MASEKQIEANRRNAQLSTGPTTPQGKATVSRNALKHGLRSRKVLFNDDGELDRIREALIAEWQPRTYTEAILIEQAAVALLKRTTFEELEANVAEELMASNLAGLQALWRRQAALTREFHKSLDQLIKLRRARAHAKPTTPPAEAVPEPESPSSQPRSPNRCQAPVFPSAAAGVPPNAHQLPTIVDERSG